MPGRRPEKREFRGGDDRRPGNRGLAPASGGRDSGGRVSGGKTSGADRSEANDRRPGTRRRPSERPSYGTRPGDARKPEFRRAPNRRSSAPIDREPPSGERLQKVLAAAGIASRRDCEEYISQGRVEVDGKVVTELGIRVDPARSDIKVDGATLTKTKLVYFAVNKPAGVLCTNEDPAGRERVIDLVPSKDRLFTVGRLDQFSEGLILVTNDGELANKLAHPRYEVPKEYLVEVAGHLSAEDIRKLLKGVHLAEGVAKVDKLYIRHRRPGCMILEMILREGKNREIRRVLARLGHKVMKLKRVAYGPLRLAKMPLGAHRRLTIGEVKKLENYDPRQDKHYGRRTKTEKPQAEETESLLREPSIVDATSSTPRKRARREAADLHGHLEGAPPGRVLRRPKPIKGGKPLGEKTQGKVLGGEPKIKLNPKAAKFVRPWDKPVDDDLDEV
jgi:23S rRNA pseudouridine2605 synthase